VFAKAVPYLEEAVEMDPEDFASLYRLGVAWERTGEREKAKEAFRRFIKGWEGDASYMRAAEEKLEELEGKVP
jgi:tetratricopeptide (TPR) repeat protein